MEEVIAELTAKEQVKTVMEDPIPELTAHSQSLYLHYTPSLASFLQKAKTKERMGVKAAMEEVIAELTAKEQDKTVMEDPIPELTLKQEQQQTESTDIIRELRDLPPAHYLLKIENFSQLSIAKVENYESSDFDVGGYKWRLSLYPKGNKKVNEDSFISLYLVLSDLNALPLHKEVNVCFKLFVYNQIQDKYLAVQDSKGRVRRFRGTKTEWGFDQLISLNVFNDASSGYLVDDCCIFGAEIFVIERAGKGECMSIVKELVNNTNTWTLEKFSAWNSEYYTSQVFVIGGHKWSLMLYPNGFSTEKGKSLSMFLYLEDSGNLDSGRKLLTVFIPRVRDQLLGEHREQKVAHKFHSSGYCWGFSDLIPLSDLKDASKGFMVDNKVILEVKIPLMTLVKEFS